MVHEAAERKGEWITPDHCTRGAIAGPTLGVALLMYSLTKIPTGLAMTFISLMPIMIMPFSVILFKEHISPRAIVGAVIACIGSALLLR